MNTQELASAWSAIVQYFDKVKSATKPVLDTLALGRAALPERAKEMLSNAKSLTKRLSYIAAFGEFGFGTASSGPLDQATVSLNPDTATPGLVNSSPNAKLEIKGVIDFLSTYIGATIAAVSSEASIPLYIILKPVYDALRKNIFMIVDLDAQSHKQVDDVAALFLGDPGTSSTSTVPAVPSVTAPVLTATTSAITVQTTADPTTINLGAAFASDNITASVSGSNLVLSNSAGGSLTIKDWLSGGGLVINVPSGAQWTTSSIQAMITPATSNLTFQPGTVHDGSQFASVVSSLGDAFVRSDSTNASLSSVWQAGIASAVATGQTIDGNVVYTYSMSDQGQYSTAQPTYGYRYNQVYDAAEFSQVVGGLGSVFAADASYYGSTLGYPDYLQHVFDLNTANAVNTGLMQGDSPIYRGGWRAGTFTPDAGVTQVIAQLEFTEDSRIRSATQAYALTPSMPDAVVRADMWFNYWRDSVTGHWDFAITNAFTADGGNTVTSPDGTTSVVPLSNIQELQADPGVYGVLPTNSANNGYWDNLTYDFWQNAQDGSWGFAIVSQNNGTGGQSNLLWNPDTQAYEPYVAPRVTVGSSSQTPEVVGTPAVTSVSLYTGGTTSTTSAPSYVSGSFSEALIGSRVDFTVLPDGTTQSCTYTDSGILVSDSVFNPTNGASSGHTYTANGSTSQVWTNDGHGTTTNKVIDGQGNSIEYDVTANGETISKYGIDTSSNVVTYNSAGVLTASRDVKANGDVASYALSSNGTKHIWTSDALGNTADMLIDTAGSSTSSYVNADGSHGGATDDANGSSTSSDYGTGLSLLKTDDGHHNTTSDFSNGQGERYQVATYSDGSMWSETNGADGAVTTVDVDALGYGTSSTRNADGSGVDTASNEDGSSSITSYDVGGILLYGDVVSASGTEVKSNYGAGVLVVEKTTAADGSAHGRDFNTDGSPLDVWAIDGQGNRTLVTYGNGLKIADFSYKADGTSSGHTYDAFGIWVSSWSKDAAGRLSMNVFDGSGNTLDLVCNSAGSLLSLNKVYSTTASNGTTHGTDGSTTTWTNDGNGHVTKHIVFADGSTEDCTITADSVGNATEHDVFSNGTIQDSVTAADGTLTSDSQTLPDGSSSGHTYGANGVVTTWTNDGHGNTVSTTPDGLGNVTRHSVFANGTVTDSVSHADGSGSSQTHAADGTLTVDSSTLADGSYTDVTISVLGVAISQTHSPTGYLTASSTTNADGSGTRFTDDGQGDTTHVTEASDGSSVEYDVNSDGSKVAIVTNSDGSSVETDTAANGTYRTVATAVSGNSVEQDYDATRALGQTVVTNYNADGAISKHTVLADGTMTDTLRQADGSGSSQTHAADGTLTRDSSTLADGSSRGHTYGANGAGTTWTNDGHGSTSEHNVFANGSTHDSSKNADGSTSQQSHDSSGVLQSSSYANADGSHGSCQLNTDGSRWTTAAAADGTSTGTLAQADGSTSVSHRNALGVVTSATSSSPNGSHSDYTRNADGSVVSHQFNADGSTSDFKQAVDGSTTQNTYFASGVLQNTHQTNPDGSSTSFTDDGQGNTIEHDVFSDGSSKDLLTGPDGSTSVSHRNALGVVTSGTGSSPNGSHWDCTWNADGSSVGHEFNLDGSHSTSTATGSGAYESQQFNVDGSTGDFKQAVDGSTAQATYSASGVLQNSSYANADGSSGSYSLNSDGSSSGRTHGANGTVTTWTDNGQGNTTEHDVFADGSTKDIGTGPDGSSSTATYNPATGASAMTWIGADGSIYSSSQDGAGNGLESCSYSDGSHSATAYFADGSSWSKSYDATDTLVSWSANNVDGSSWSKRYDATGTLVSWSTNNADGSSVFGYSFGAEYGYQESYVNVDGSGGGSVYDAANVLTNSYAYAADGSGESKAYDDAGHVLQDTVSTSAGAGHTNFFALDGTITESMDTARQPDGSTTYVLHSADGTTTSGVRANDGSTNSSFYSGTGVLQATTATGAWLDNTMVSGADGVAHLTYGGSGNDTLTGNGVLIGGHGNDTVAVTNADTAPVDILFNKGDGVDTITGLGAGAAGRKATLSLGGGLQYSDISLSRNGNDLVLHAGANDTQTLAGWYASAGTGQVDAQINLQMIATASDAFIAGTLGADYSHAVEEFNLNTFAASFDAAQAADPSVTSFNMTQAITDFFVSSSDSMAIGGDNAWYYASQDGINRLSVTAASAALVDPAFNAQTPQAIHPLSTLQSGSMSLWGN